MKFKIVRTRPVIEGDRFPETPSPDQRRALYRALRRRRAKNKVAKQARKRNRRAGLKP